MELRRFPSEPLVFGSWFCISMGYGDFNCYVDEKTLDRFDSNDETLLRAIAI
jgi:hypothetical protein